MIGSNMRRMTQTQWSLVLLLLLAMAACGCSAISTHNMGSPAGKGLRSPPKGGLKSSKPSKPPAHDSGGKGKTLAKKLKPTPPSEGGGGHLTPTQMMSKIIGLAVMSGSFMLKMPQIVKILRTQSVEGLSSMAIYHEIPLYSSGVIYHWLHNFPLSTYGEMLVIMIQNIIVVLLLWIYRVPRVPTSEVLQRTAEFVLLCFVQMKLPKALRPLLIYVNIPLLITSCVPQIVANHRQRHTGTLAISTCAMKAMGSAMRVFTTLAEIGGDKGLLASYGLSTALNGWMVLQGWLYREETARVLNQESRKRK